MLAQIIKTDQASATLGPQSQAVVANGLVFVGGQVALDPRTDQLIQGDIRTQTKQVMENIKVVLAAAGSSIDQVIKATVFLRDLNDCGIMNETYWSYFQENFPARSVVQVAKLRRGATVEIEVVALAQDR